LAGEAGFFARAVEGAFGMAWGFVELLALGLDGAHFFADAGEELGGGGVELGKCTDFFAAHRFDGGFEDGFGDVVWIVEGFGKFWFLVHVVFGVLGEGSIGGGGLDESDGDGSFIDLFDFDAECIGETFDGVFGGGIHALVADDGFGDFAADVDECAAAGFEVGQGGE
jgi:hypothetical protein